MDEQTKSQLQQAYALIKAGNRADALKLIDPILKSEPDNEMAWWLAANTVTNPRHVEYALNQVLRINPNHGGAKAKLAELIFEVAPVPAPFATPVLEPSKTTNWMPSQSPPAKQNQSSHLLTGVLVVIAVGLLMGVIAAVIIVLGKDDKPSSPTQSAFNANPTPNAPIDNSEAVPTRPSAEGREELPPTWTPNPTIPTATLPPYYTSTPRPTDTPFSTSRPIVTIDPVNFGDTYWLGNGDGTTMELYYANGRYWRFYEFPVTIYFESEGSDLIWDYAVKNAIAELNQVIEVERTDDERQADIVLKIVDAIQLAKECEVSDIFVVAGCATFRTWGGSARPDFRGFAFVSTAAFYPVAATLHELVHSLGVVVHSPDPDDIMYFQETPNTSLSIRDINTLRRLYGSPSFGD
ncbi:MAG: hypothetical protein K8L91_10290 [Anaerolineae bacterium]|nr:hypothetical protein [Anaerolineae bacterium]